MHLPKLTGRERSLAQVVAVFLAALTLYYMFFRTPLQSFLQLYRQANDTRRELIEMEYALLRQEQIQAECDRFDKAILATGSDAEELAFVLKELEVLARPVSMEIKSIKPLAPQTVGPYKKFLVQMETEGKVTAIMEFLYSVRASPKVLNVEKLRLRALRKGPNMLAAGVLISRTSAGSGATRSTTSARR